MTARIRVLYADDESDLLEIGKQFLEQSGDFTVTTTMSASEALRLLEQEKFDAIISDYQMPGMDGIQFLVEVRIRFGKVPFILFTGRGREEVVIQAINSGADFYLQKGGEPKAQFAELTHKIKAAASSKRADDALRKSEEKYRHLIEHSDEAIVVVQDGMLKLVNHRTIDFTGYSEQELLSMQFSAFIHPDDRAMVVERYQKRIKGEEGLSRYAFRLSSKDGSTRWVELSVVVIDWDGRPATLNFLTDITERKRADDSLREEQQFSKLLLDSLPGIFYLYTYPENRMVRWNKQHETLLGYTAEEIKGKLGTDLHLPEYKDAVLKAIDEVMEKGQSSVESTLLAKDGHLIPFFFTGVRFEAPGQLYFMGIGIDITERKQAEDALLKNTEELHAAYEELTATDEELRANLDELIRQEHALQKSEEKFHTLYQHMIEGAALHELTYDDHGIPEDYVIIETNPAFEVQLGITKDTVIGKTSREAYGVAEPPFLEIYTRVALTGEPEVFETYFPPLAKHFSISVYSLGKGRFATIFEDITERKRAELELVSAHDRLKEAHCLAHVGTWDWVIETDTVTWSEELCTIAGWDPSLPAPTYAELPRIYTPSSWNLLSDAVTRALTMGEQYNLELEMVRPDGSIRWTNAFGGVLRDGNEKIVGLHGTVQDITDRKRTEEALRKSEEMFRAIADYTVNWESWFGPDGKYIWVSPSVTGFTGYSAEEILAMPDFISTMIAEEDRPLFTERFREAVQGIRGENFEFRYLHRDGTKHWLNASWQPIFDMNGNSLGTRSSGQNITGRKVAEEALRESERRMKDIISFLPDATLVIDKNGTVLAWNRAMEEMTGFPAEQMIGKADYEYALPFYHERRPITVDLVLHDDPAVVEKYPFMQTEGRSRRSEIFIPHLNKGRGAYLWFVASPLYDANGNLTGAIESIRDITDRKRADDAIRVANKKLNLLSGITRHDLKNQLLSLNGYLGISKKYIDDAAKMSEFITKEEKIAKNMERQIAFTKEYESIGINAPVWQNIRTVVDTAAKQAPLGEVMVKNDLLARHEMFADPLVVKVFYNLIDNAVRYGGKITSIRFSVEEHDGDHVVVCEDDGDGVPADEKEKIFERGFGKNTGLGLALAWEILFITGITIKETGEPGKGARFEMTVPKGAYR